MSDWFRPLPQALDSISYAIKVLNVIFSATRELDYVPAVPTGCTSNTAPILSFTTPAVSPGLRSDKKGAVRLEKVAFMKMVLSSAEFLYVLRENEALRRENEHFRLQLYQQGDEGYSTNANGKRQKKSVYE